jgi:ABC-type transporter Mla maintaining outer membrane lipid asymmetry permease subunit MlaE
VSAAAREWIAAFRDIAKFSARVAYIASGRAFAFFGEALRQAGILVLGSALVIWGLAFILGPQCGIEGAYFGRSVGAPSNAGVFAAWCDLREIMPYAFGYTAGGGPVGVGTATAKSMVLNTVLVHLVGMVGTQIFWGTNPRAPIGG